jgi:hypothetical protein
VTLCLTPVNSRASPLILNARASPRLTSTSEAGGTLSSTPACTTLAPSSTLHSPRQVEGVALIYFTPSLNRWNILVSHLRRDICALAYSAVFFAAGRPRLLKPPRRPFTCLVHCCLMCPLRPHLEHCGKLQQSLLICMSRFSKSKTFCHKCCIYFLFYLQLLITLSSRLYTSLILRGG